MVSIKVGHKYYPNISKSLVWGDFRGNYGRSKFAQIYKQPFPFLFFMLGRKIGIFIFELEIRSVERGICPIAPLALRLTLYSLTGSRV